MNKFFDKKVVICHPLCHNLKMWKLLVVIVIMLHINFISQFILVLVGLSIRCVKTYFLIFLSKKVLMLLLYPVKYCKRIPACPRKIPTCYQNKKLPRNLVLSNFGILIIIFSTKINLLCVLFLIMLSCYLLDLIKRKGFLQPFLRILILKSHAVASVLPVFVLFS